MELEIILTIVIFETLILMVIAVVLSQKSKHISKLADELSELRRQDKISEFIPMLVHELRAPLSVIKGGSDLMLREAENLNPQQIRDLLSQIKTSSKSLLNMVNDILDVSKLDAGKFEINKEFLDLNDVLGESCGYFKPLSKVKNLTFETSFDESIGSISIDRERIKQVMNNLLSNAIKFTDESGIIKVTTKKIKKEVFIYVYDTGIGVTDKDKKLLFHKFQQAHNHKGVTEGGTGLGLVIAKGIIESHGGKIWIEDNHPKGTKFVFTLPTT